MFQDINVAKSAPFALLTKYQKILVSPQSFQNRPHFDKLCENDEFKGDKLSGSDFCTGTFF